MDELIMNSYSLVIREKDKAGKIQVLFMSKKNNISVLGLTELYNRLNRLYSTIPMPEIYYSPIREDKRKQYIDLSKITIPLNMRRYWWMYHNNDYVTEFEAIIKSNDIIDQYKSIAILDQLNHVEVPCYYCGLPFSGFSSSYLNHLTEYKRDIEDEFYGVEFGVHWQMCSFCVGMDISELLDDDRFHLALFDETSGGGCVELLQPGDAAFGLIEDDSILSVRYIRNYYDIMAATSTEEIEAITQQWEKDFPVQHEVPLKIRRRK